MQKTFTNQNLWALILGGSSGLGLASAKKLAQHGMNICILHRNPRTQQDDIEGVFNAIRHYGVEVITYNTDALNANKREDVITELKTKLGTDGKIKTLVHSIAKGNLKPMISAETAVLKQDDFLLTINAMAVSLYDWTKALFHHNIFAADARIISFTSEGNTKAWQNYAAVSAAKVALESITRSIALEFAPYGIKANCIQAGVTDTISLRRIPNSNNIIKHTLKRNPNARLTLPADVANVVYLLSLNEAAWITGSVIPVDGGEHLQ